MAKAGNKYTCKKCGSVDVTLKYQSEGIPTKTKVDVAVKAIFGVSDYDEWLQVTCDGCGYSWRSEVLERG